MSYSIGNTPMVQKGSTRFNKGHWRWSNGLSKSHDVAHMHPQSFVVMDNN
jgi:hypothetical protein